MSDQKAHVGIFAFAKSKGKDEDEKEIVIPESFEGVSDEDLDALEDRIVASFNELDQSEALDASTLETMGQLAEAVGLVRTERSTRENARVEAQAEKDNLRSQVTAQDEGETEGEGDAEGDAEGETEGDGETEPEPTEAEAAPETPAEAPVAVAAAAAKPPAEPKRGPRRINYSLAEIRAKAPPKVDLPHASTILAAADVPGVHAGAPLETRLDLAKAVSERCRTTPVTTSGTISGPKVASIMREFDLKLSLDAGSEEVERVLTAATNVDSLVAAGGWCAPSSIIYDFFNIADEDGMLDLPTIGITRGGVRFPVSPSLADVFTNIWLWTETDDIATITGGPNKPCFRPPCPSFLEERLECHGLCVTAGNLTDNAFPELIANHLSLTMAAHFHVMNTRHIADIVSQSVAVDITEGTPAATTASVLGAVELQVWDYRTKFGMADSRVLEVVLPGWIKGQIRSDLAKRTGVEMLDVTDADIGRWFDIRSVRVQFVQDWQVRASGFPGQATAAQDWPATVQFLIYAAGTYVLGQGMVLDLGVTRDSVLNAENDFTAAWTEDCRLIAKIGHESRVCTVTADNYGGTGAVNITGTGA
jgi:hypothetical protein